jgi:2-iminobutanoate/2-iminopropanoate deaminase
MRSALKIAIGLSLVLSSAAAAQRQAIVPAGQTPSPTLTPAIKYGDVVYLSGALGTSREAGADTTIQAQTKRALDNLQKVAQAAGTTLANSTKCTVFLVDVKDFSGMNQAYREVFPKDPPARSTIVVAALVVPGAKVEIECIVGMPK